MSRFSGQRRAGLSRVDVVVALALVAVGASLLLPAVYAVQQRNAAKQMVNNLKQVTLSIHSFEGAYKKLPPAYETVGPGKFAVHASLHIHVLPYIEQTPLHMRYVQATMNGMKVAPVVVPPFLSSMDPSLKNAMTEGIQNCAANLRVFADAGVKTAYDKDMPALRNSEPGTESIARTFLDGTSNTIVFATKYAYCGEGGSRYESRPNTRTAAFFGRNAAKKKAHVRDKEAAFQLMPNEKDCLCTPLMAQSFLREAIFVATGDGVVRSIKSNISPESWNRAMQPNDGKKLGKDWRASIDPPVR